MRNIGKTAQKHKWECKRDDQILCTRTTNYGLSTCQEDTSGKIWKTIPCYGRIQIGDQALANHKKW